MIEKVKVPAFRDCLTESNEVIVLYNFYSRVAKTTGIVKMSRKIFSDVFPLKAPFC